MTTMMMTLAILLNKNIGAVGEAPLKKSQGLFGHCPNGGGGLGPCPNGLGHLYREELSMFKGAFACVGGV